jgi:hypothetical protein
LRSKLLIVFISLAFIITCCKESKPPPQQKVQSEDYDNPADTNLSPEEKFSAAVLIDFLNDSDDEELAGYLETEIYKMGSGYKGASVAEISPAVWLVMLDKEGDTKNYLLQKFFNFKTNGYYFKIKETSLTITDIISKSRNKTPAGE